METTQNPIPSSPTPAYNLNAQKLHTKKTLYLAGFIISIIFTILVAVYGIILISNSLIALKDGFPNSSDLINKELVLAIGLMLTGILLLLLSIWMIIATVWISRQRNELGTEKEKQHLAFAICVLVFANIITGILILVANCIFLEPPTFDHQINSNK